MGRHGSISRIVTDCKRHPVVMEAVAMVLVKIIWPRGVPLILGNPHLPQTTLHAPENQVKTHETSRNTFWLPTKCLPAICLLPNRRPPPPPRRARCLAAARTGPYRAPPLLAWSVRVLARSGEPAAFTGGGSPVHSTLPGHLPAARVVLTKALCRLTLVPSLVF